MKTDILPTPMIRGDDNLIDDISLFISYIIDELTNWSIKIKMPIERRLPNPTNDFFVSQIIVEKRDILYSLKFVFNKKGHLVFGLFSLNPLTRIMLEGEMNTETFFEKFFSKITNQLI